MNGIGNFDNPDADRAAAALKNLLWALGSASYLAASPDNARLVSDVLRVSLAEVADRADRLARNPVALGRLQQTNFDGIAGIHVLAGVLATVA